MIKRIISASILIPLAIICILFAPIVIVKMLVLILCGISFYEWMNFYPMNYRIVYLFFALIFCANLMFGAIPNFELLLILFVIHMILGFLNVEKEFVLTQYYLFGGILYVSLYTFFAKIMALENGRWIFLLICISIWVGDSFAYFCGKSFGKVRLASTISPKKTYEGAICGVVSGTIFAVFFAVIFKTDTLMASTIGFVANLMGIFGDLAESVIKRIFNKKDSSNLIPGHGGMLDRLDSLALSAFIVYIMFLWKIF